MKPARVSHTSCQPEMEGSGEKGLASLIHSVFWVDRAPPQWLWGTSRDGGRGTVESFLVPSPHSWFGSSTWAVLWKRKKTEGRETVVEHCGGANL